MSNVVPQLVERGAGHIVNVASMAALAPIEGIAVYSEVTDAILDSLRRRPIEVFLPRSRGWLARLADVFPGPARSIGPLLRKKGLAKQRGTS